MASDEYDLVELPALTQLQSLGWEYIDGAELAPDASKERASLSDVVLRSRLEDAIKRINPWINETNLNQVVRSFTNIQKSTLLEANQWVWETLTQYISVEQDLGKGRKGQTVKVIDFDNPENNEFLCTNQFKVSGVNQNIIPDITLFVNGLPLVVIECKSPYVTNPMESGINQLLRYANLRAPHDDEGAEKLFRYNQLMISTCRDNARVGTISSRMEHYLEWKDPYPLTPEDISQNPNSQELLITGILGKSNLLDLIQNFTIFEPVDGKTIKKIARYQQFRAVHKTIKRIKTGNTKKERGGVIWHTQGSGKSLTMVFLTIKMRRDAELKQYKLVFVTDRTQLDNQLTSTFQNAQEETVYNASSVAHLKELLKQDSSNLITAMVQKFQETEGELEFPVLNTSDKVVIMADEAHRTQYGSLGVALNIALPNAPKIAFTGTPLIKTEKTSDEFGSYIDTYTIEQAVKDGATIQILYEGREAQLNVIGDSLDSLFSEYFKDKTEDEREAIKKKFGTRTAVLQAPQRIRRVCIDILKHYRNHIQPNGFKAMIVTQSRQAAITFKQELDNLEAPESVAIISGDHNDQKEFWEYTDRKKQAQQIKDFTKPLGSGDGQSNLSILIVKDMLLTGFNAPICQAMYLDKKLMDHSLLQAIARVNRTYKNKFRGYIIDYYGLSDYLSDALAMFTKDDIEGALKNLKDEIPKLKATHTRVMKHFTKLGLDDLDTCILSLENEVKRKEFEIDFTKFAKQMDIILPDVSAGPYISDLNKLGKIAHGARNRYRDELLNIAAAGEKVKKLIDEHIYSTGIDPKIAPMELLAPNYKEKLNEHKDDRSKASEIEHAIKHHIKVNIDEDPEYYQKLSERLRDIIAECEEKWDELAQMLLIMRENIEENRIKGAKDIGLSETEYAFYNILIAALTKHHSDDTINDNMRKNIIELVRELVVMMEKATSIVDFFDKQDEKKRVQKEIKRAVLKQQYGTKTLVSAVTDRFMELARVKFK